MAAVIISALALCTASTVVGRAILVLAELRAAVWLSPVTGFAALLVLALGAMALPGAGTTAVFVVGLALAGAVAVLLRSRPLRWDRIGEALPTAALTLLLAIVPFLAYGRAGVLGVLDNADLATHLELADAARDGRSPAGLAPELAGYPIGPHALTAVLASTLRIDLVTAFNGLLVSVAVLTALTALAGLGHGPRVLRVAAAVAAGLPFLAAAYLIQSAFKETVLGLLVMAFALTLRRLSRDGSWTYGSVIPLGLLSGAVLATYSAPGLVWPLTVALAWAVAEITARRSLPPLGRIVTVVAVILGVVLLSALAQIDALLEFADTGRGNPDVAGGNVGSDLPPFEALGVWVSEDFRVRGEEFTTGVLSGLALALAAYSAGWWSRRGDTAVPATVAACFLIYLLALEYANPYNTVKTIAVGSPTVVLMIVGCLVRGSARRDDGVRRLSFGAMGSAAVLVAFLSCALWSSLLALRNASVGPLDHAEELTSVRSLLKERQTLFLGQDDYVIPELSGAVVSFDYAYTGNSAIPLAPRPEKPFGPGGPHDFDSLDAAGLDPFDFAVLPRTSYSSSAPSNWTLRRSTRSYEVFERQGPTLPRQVLGEGGSPGAVLDCVNPGGLALSRSRGVAAVRPIPIVAGPGALTSEGAPLPIGALAFASMRTGDAAIQPLHLPPGSWEISLQYVSPTPLTLQGSGMRATLPPSLERGGPYWSAGTLFTSGERFPVTITAGDLPRLATRRDVAIGSLAAVRTGVAERLVPLSQACGSFVDWYRQE